MLRLNGVFNANCLSLDLNLCLGFHLQLLAINFLVFGTRLVHRLVGFKLITHLHFDVFNDLCIFRLLNNRLK